MRKKSTRFNPEGPEQEETEFTLAAAQKRREIKNVPDYADASAIVQTASPGGERGVGFRAGWP